VVNLGLAPNRRFPAVLNIKGTPYQGERWTSQGNGGRRPSIGESAFFFFLLPGRLTPSIKAAVGTRPDGGPLPGCSGDFFVLGTVG